MNYFIDHCTNDSAADFIVLASGLGGHANFWKPQIKFLQQYFHVLSYDQEGCHASDSLLDEQYSFQHLAQQVFNILDQEQITKFHFIGHAIGAFIGTELALLCEQELQSQPQFKQMLSLTSINAWNELDPHTAKCFEARIHLLKSAGAEAYVRAQALFLYPPAWISQSIDEITQAENQQLLAFPPIHNVLTRIKTAVDFEINHLHREALEYVALHFIGNEDDFLVPIQKTRDLQQSLGHGTMNILAHGAHASTVTQSDLINRTLFEFYKSHNFIE